MGTKNKPDPIISADPCLLACNSVDVNGMAAKVQRQGLPGIQRCPPAPVVQGAAKHSGKGKRFDKAYVKGILLNNIGVG